MVDCATELTKGVDAVMYNPPPRPNLPQPVRLTNMKPSAEALLNKLKRLEDNTRPNVKEDQDVAVELHTPSGAVIRIGEIGFYLDTDDVLLVKGMDIPSGDPCAAIVPVQNFYVVFRVTTVEDPAQTVVQGTITEKTDLGIRIDDITSMDAESMLIAYDGLLSVTVQPSP